MSERFSTLFTRHLAEIFNATCYDTRMPVTFGIPWLLILLPLLPLLPQQRLRWLRILVLACFIVALAQPSIRGTHHEVAVLFDVSESVGMNAVNTLPQLSLETPPQTFVFANDTTTYDGETLPEFLEVSQTDIARALQVAAGSGAKRVLLVSDGAQSLGNAMSALPNLPVDVFHVESQPNVRLAGLLAPEEASPGETVEATAVIESDIATTVTLLPTLSGGTLEPIFQEIQPGRTAIPLRFQVTGDEDVELSTTLQTETEQPTSDDVQSTVVSVRGRSPILVINDPAMAQLLGAQGFDVREGNASDVTEPFEYSAVVLRSGAGAFTPGQLELLERYVLNGGGLMMTGGRDTFGFGAWYRTPVEDVLPVNTDLRTEVQLPLVALVIILDRSQSMSTGNPSKLELAKEGALGVVDLAYQEDLLGMIVFSDGSSTEWAFDIRKATEQGKREMTQAILNIEPEGGTVLRPAYEMALAALRDTEAAIKHIIILSDGKLNDAANVFGGNGTEVDFNIVAATALSLNITTSTIAIGNEADFERLESIATSGGGRYYQALDVTTLPRIFANEALTATRSLLREETFSPTLRSHPLVANSTTSVPTLNAYVATTLKPSSEMLLEGLEGEPILAVSRQGLGRSAVFTTDLNAWAGNLGTWETLPGLLGTTMRWLQARPAQFEATVKEEGTELHVVVDAVKDGQYLNDETLELRYGGVTVPLEQTGAGRYEASVLRQADAQTLLVVDGNEIVARETLRSQGSEFATAGGEALLRSIAEQTGGQVITDLTEYRPTTVSNDRAIWMYAALAGLGLFMLELILRRFASFPSLSKATKTNVKV
jgi:Ca-activated chloride channel homolog